jgi:hypothetical protein
MPIAPNSGVIDQVENAKRSRDIQAEASRKGWTIIHDV